MARKARAPSRTDKCTAKARQGLLSSQLSPGAIAAANAKLSSRNGGAFQPDIVHNDTSRDEFKTNLPVRLLLARCYGTRNPAFKSIPAHNQIRMQALTEHSEAADSIFLGISSDGLCLFSYSFEQVLQGRVAFAFQIWKLKNHGLAFVGDMSKSHNMRNKVPYLQLLGSYPLFADNKWASSSNVLVGGDAVRVTLWESPDQRCIVAVGTMHERGMHGPQPCHISILPYPVLVPPSPTRHALPLAPPVPAAALATGLQQPSSPVLHITVVISSPYPSPSIVGFQCVPSPTCDRVYRLVLSTGDGQCCCELKVRGLGRLPSRDSRADTLEEGSMAALHSIRYSLPDLQAALASPWHTGTHSRGEEGQQASNQHATTDAPLCPIGMQDDAVVDSWLQEPPPSTLAVIPSHAYGQSSAVSAALPPLAPAPAHVAQEVHVRADGTVSLEEAVAVLEDRHDPRSALGAPFLQHVRHVDGEHVVCASLAARGYPRRVVRNFDCRLVCLLEPSRAAGLLKTAVLPHPLGPDRPCSCSTPPGPVPGQDVEVYGSNGHEGEGEGEEEEEVAPFCIGRQAGQGAGHDFMILCCLVDYEDVLVSSSQPASCAPPSLPLGPLPSHDGVNAQPLTQGGSGKGGAKRTYGKDRASTGSSKSSGTAGEKRGREEEALWDVDGQGQETRIDTAPVPARAGQGEDGETHSASTSSSSPNTSGEDAWALVEPAQAQNAASSSSSSSSEGERRWAVEGASSCSTDASGSSSLVSDSTSAQRFGRHSQSSVRRSSASHWQLQPVAKHGPLVRDELLVAINLTTGCQHLVRHSRLPPSQQPAFDSREGTSSVPATGAGDGAGAGGGGGGASRTLTRLTSACVNALRVLPALRPRPGTLARELTNDSVLAGQSLSALVNPVLPMALVL